MDNSKWIQGIRKSYTFRTENDKALVIITPSSFHKGEDQLYYVIIENKEEEAYNDSVMTAEAIAEQHDIDILKASDPFNFD